MIGVSRSSPMADQDAKPQPQNPNPSPKPNPSDRDFLLHLEAYLARRDGVDKFLKISRYTSKLLLSSSLPLPQTLTLNLHSFESNVGLSRKAFRLGKFVQDLNSLRFSDLGLLSLLAYGGEGIYYFIEQIVWLSKSGLISSDHSKRLSKISAWAELIGYVGSISIKVRDLKELRSKLDDSNDEKRRLLREKILAKRLSLIQDLADALMVLGDVRDGKGVGTSKVLMASAGLVSAVISTHKNWKSSCWEGGNTSPPPPPPMVVTTAPYHRQRSPSSSPQSPYFPPRTSKSSPSPPSLPKREGRKREEG